MTKRKWNWLERLTRYRLKARKQNNPKKTKPEKQLTMDNTVQTVLTDFYPRMMVPDDQQSLVDWGALEPQIHVGLVGHALGVKENDVVDEE